MTSLPSPRFRDGVTRRDGDRAPTVAIALITALAPLGFATSVLANPIDRNGVGATTSEVAGVSSLGEDPTVAAHNPSALARASFGAAVMIDVAWSVATIDLKDRPPEVDVGDAINGDAIPAGGWPADSLRPLPSDQVSTRGGREIDPAHMIVMGAAAAVWRDRLFAGFVAHAPITELQQSNLPIYDERAQYFDNQLHWFYLGAAQSYFSLAPMVAFAATPWLRVGVGFWLDQSVVTEVHIFLPDVLEPDQSLQTLRSSVHSSFSPLLGLSVGPWRGLTVELAYHEERGSTIESQTAVRTRDPALDGAQELSWSVGFVPRRAELSLAWRDPGQRWAVGVNAIARQWSAFAANGIFAEELSDSYEARAGARAHINPSWHVAGGVAWAATPVREQTGRTNLVDNDRLSLTLGGGLVIQRPARAWRFGLATRLTRLIPFTHEKRTGAEYVFDEFPDSYDINGELVDASTGFQTNNPGYPGYRSQGWIGAVTITVATDL